MKNSWDGLTPKYNWRKFPYKREYYQPWYDTNADYNTNAKSYYDYLARYNRFLGIVEDYLNRLLDRDLTTEETESVILEKIGTWLDNGETPPNNFDDVITLKARVKRSLYKGLYGEFTLDNALRIFDDGLYVEDFTPVLDDLYSQLNDVYSRLDTIEQNLTAIFGKLDDLETVINSLRDDLEQQINILQNDLNNKYTELNTKYTELNTKYTDLNNKYNTLQNSLQKIVSNLYTSGAITTNNINSFEFKTGRNIATGNINLFGGVQDGTSFIRTNDLASENDITAGI